MCVNLNLLVVKIDIDSKVAASRLDWWPSM